MVIDIQKYIKRHSLLSFSDKVLCTVSGGVDSMVLSHILISLGYDVSIAHCNFSLRGDESDGDERLVEEFAKNQGVKLHKIRFATSEYAQKNGLSTQMAARELRYEWFESLRKEFGYNKIAVAHNADDTIETFFINLTRSTGVEGMGGIKVKNGAVVRPLMFASRKRIIDYSLANGVSYRMDSSNLKNSYLRNWFRLDILPLIRKRETNFDTTMISNMEHVSSHISLFKHLMIRVRKEIMISDNEIDLVKIKEYGGDSLELLFEMLKEFGFSLQNCRSILSVESSGRLFLSSTHRAVVDRGVLVIEKINASELDDLGELIIEKVSEVDFSQLLSSEIVVDGDKISGELKLRRWQKGDTFKPLGMRGKKKVSDLMIDLKYSLFEKENQLIVEDDSGIVWVVGRRSSENHKIEKNTKNIIKISYLCKKIE